MSYIHLHVHLHFHFILSPFHISTPLSSVNSHRLPLHTFPRGALCYKTSFVQNAFDITAPPPV